jgi:predicted permease
VRIRTDIDEEFQFHLDMRVAELRARGLAPERAHAEAMRRFGDVSDAKEYCRTMDERSTHEEQRRAWFAELGSDVRFAARQLRRSPIFASLAIVTLALGIGATTAIFSVVNRLVLDPIPYPGGDRIVSLSRVNTEGNLYVTPTTKLIAAWRARAKSLEGIATFGWNDVVLAGRDEPEEVKAGTISAELLPLLQVKPVLGRGILPEDTRVGAPGVVMLGYGLWQRRFGGARDVLGQSLTIDGKSYTVVGVMPRDFTVPFMDAGVRPLWMPLPDDPNARGAQAVAKLRVGVDRARVDRELSEVMTALGAEDPEFKEWKGKASRPQDYLGDSTRDTLLILLGAVGMVLLIACANVANLLLARASTRQREFAIRSALGAGRWRIIRQLLTESALLAVAGGALGLFVAQRGLEIIIAFRPDRLAELDEVRLSPTVLLVSVALTVMTGILFGLAPALFAAARDIGDSLKSATRTASGHRGTRRLRNMLVIGEVTLSVLLLVGAGLLIRTIVQMNRADLGFEPRGLTAANIQLPEKKYSSREMRRVAWAQVLERVRSISGISEVTWAGGIPPRAGVSFGQLEVEGAAVKENERSAALWSQWGNADYFRTLRLPLVAGRVFSADTSVKEVILNQTMADRYWPGASAIGRRMRLDPKSPWMTVVGVAKNITVPSTGRQTGGISDFQVYWRFTGDFESATLLFRTATPIPDIPRRLTRELRAIDGAIRVREVTGVDVSLAKQLAGPRFNMSLLVAFAGLALVLATIGLYGVIAYSVSQRTREMGIRLALGAGQPAVLRLVLSQGARLTVIGLIAGLGAAVGLTRVMVGMLYGVSPLDPLTFVLVGGILSIVALLASYFPARRATQVDPVIALRAE